MRAFIDLAYQTSKCGFTWEATLVAHQALVYVSSFLSEQDIICIDGPVGQEFFKAQFPIAMHACPVLKISTDKDNATVCLTAVPLSARRLLSDTKWSLLGTNGACWIFERNNELRKRALRHGLLKNDVESLRLILDETILNWVSSSTLATQNLRGKGLANKLLTNSSAAVAIWFDGQLRGSAITERLHFADGIQASLHASLADRRFVPLSSLEAENATYEIVRIGTSQLSLLKNVPVSPELGYHFETQNSSAQGWYLPEVFNTREFASSVDFFTSLARDKAASSKAGKIGSHVVDSWILPPKAEIFALRGPGKKVSVDELDSYEDMERIAKSLITWLASVQFPDGSFPQSIHPRTGRSRGFDVERMTHLSLVLQEVESVFPLLPIRSILGPLESSLARMSRLVDKSSTALIYMARALLARKNNAALMSAIKSIQSSNHDQRHNVVLMGPHQIWLFEQLPQLLKVFSHPAHRIIDTIEKSITTDGNPAMYIEAALSFQENNPSFALRVRKAACMLQRADGSFPGDTRDSISYSRGTGKIFEVLALFPELWADHGRPALQWLLSLQITPETSYWILPSMRKVAEGGVRHDVFDQSLWIDSAAHLLLGCARRAAVLKKNEY